LFITLIIEVDQNRNYYNCREFEHSIRYCRNWRIIREDKRIKVLENEYLKEKEDQDLDWVPSITNLVSWLAE